VALLANAALPLLAGRWELTGRRLPDGQHEMVKLDPPQPDKFKQLDAAGMSTVRDALAREIKTIFVRPPAKRSKTAPVEDRVHIVWADSDEQLELPTRGEAFAPRAYAW
jgi:hypothetical protein